MGVSIERPGLRDGADWEAWDRRILESRRVFRARLSAMAERAVYAVQRGDTVQIAVLAEVNAATVRDSLVRWETFAVLDYLKAEMGAGGVPYGR